MTKVVAGMTVSLDGFIADPSGSAERLYTDLAALQGSEYMNAMIDRTGAVIMGRKSYAMAPDPDDFVDNYEFKVPIFVVTHRPPAVAPKQDEHLTFTFVTDGVQSAVTQAAAATGDKDVTVIGGADVIRQLLRAGLVDELHVDVMPVLLGSGLRLFDDAELEEVRLEKLEVREVGERTHLRFRITP